MSNYQDSSKNAMKHGCCATNHLLLPTDNPEDFKALESIWIKAYNPTNDPERHLVQNLVQADWLLQRATKTHAEIETRLLTTQPNPLDWTEVQQRILGRFLRYKTTHLNNFLKCKKAMEDYRKARLAEKTNAERHEVFKQKNRPEPTWKEHIENMRQQAIALGLTKPGFNPAKR